MAEFRPPERKRGARLAFAVVLPLILLVPLVLLASTAFGTMRIRYVVERDVLRIETGSVVDGDKVLPLASIRERRVVTLSGGTRTFGTAVPGYCAGRFSYTGLGSVWQATDCSSRGVLLVTSLDAVPVLVSPPDPDAFLRELASPTGATFTLAGGGSKGARALLGLLAVVVLVTAGGVSFLAAAGPSRMRYVVDGGALEVVTVFSRKRFPLAGTRAKAHVANITLRLAGTGLPGYLTGLFREGGKTTRVYATDPDRSVLLDGPTRVLVTPEDRAGFLRALREEGAEVEGLD